jgi:hypothetical protein
VIKLTAEKAKSLLEVAVHSDRRALVEKMANDHPKVGRRKFLRSLGYVPARFFAAQKDISYQTLLSNPNKFTEDFIIVGEKALLYFKL